MHSKIFSKVLCLFFFSLTLVGCVTPYQESDKGPHARVRFATRNHKNLTISVFGYKTLDCQGIFHYTNLVDGFVLMGEEKRLGIPLWNYHPNAGREFKIPSGTPQMILIRTLKMIGNQHMEEKGVFIQQTFEEGKDYEIFFNSDQPNYQASVYEIVKDEKEGFKKKLLQEKDTFVHKDFPESCLKTVRT